LGSKLDAYLTIPSLQAYIVVDQGEYWVRLYEWNDGTWQTKPLFTEKNQIVDIPSLQLEMSLAQIYEDILFP
jgi:Uma2 family endonuclease